MSEHTESKKSTVAGLILALVIAALVTWGIGLMNNADYVSAGIAGVLLFAFSAFMMLGPGKD